MTLALYDRVQQTGTANTTVSFTLSGSVAGYQSFVAVGNGNTTYYGSFDTSGNWEVGLGTYSTTGPTLTRTTILSSSNGGLAVTFSGTVNVFITYPSEKSVNQDASNNVTLPAGLTVINDASISGLTVGKGGGGAINTAFGAYALAAVNTGNYNTGIGNSALNANTSGALNTGIGQSALTSNTSGSYNSAIGGQTLQTNTTGSYNTAIGDASLYSNTTASNNTAVGYQAGYSNTTGVQNAMFGYQTGYSNTTSNYAAYFGQMAGYSTTGGFNTFIGSGAGYSVSSGAKNTIIGGYTGNQGGLDIRTASNYIVLSDGDGNPRGIFDASGTLYVGPVNGSLIFTNTVGYYTRGGSGFQRNQTANSSDWGITSTNGSICNFYSWNGSASVLAGQISVNGATTAYNSVSDYRLKENIAPMIGALDKISQLNPVTYTFKDGGQKSEGFIAHELQAIVPDAVTGEKDAIKEDGTPEYQGVDSSFLIATLTAAIQELKLISDEQTVKLEAQADLITTMQAKLKDAGVLGF